MAPVGQTDAATPEPASSHSGDKSALEINVMAKVAGSLSGEVERDLASSELEASLMFHISMSA